MKRSEEITNLCINILDSLTNDSVPLHFSLLKCSRLSALLSLNKNVVYFKDCSSDAEIKGFIVSTYNATIDAAKDSSRSFASNKTIYSNPVSSNSHERFGIRNEAKEANNVLSRYRTEAYNFVSNTYIQYQFSNIAEGIFEKKRLRIDKALRIIMPDIQDRLNSIEQNVRSDNEEDWKNAVVSCRTLLSDLANLLNPAKEEKDKDKYINRLKSFLSPIGGSKTFGKLKNDMLEELKKRIEHTSDLTQGSAHQDRPPIKYAEDVVLYTYLIVGELSEAYYEKTSSLELDSESNSS